ncbi:MAG: hypothetical protein O2820_26515 [Planctomycetota bacterium]|nr:hypothetical protein [Planctomycetota bacterium]MDA1252761.1 hypothetical protein [Planctomycetota bacterium]
MPPYLIRILIGISFAIISGGLAMNGRASVILVTLGIGCLWSTLAIHAFQVRSNKPQN